MEFSQEMKNVILDLKDMVNNHSKTINKLARVVNAQQEKIKKLEKDIEMLEATPFGIKLEDL